MFDATILEADEAKHKEALRAAHEAYHSSHPDGEKYPHLRAAIAAYVNTYVKTVKADEEKQ